MRRAGIQKAAAALGWEWSDAGDCDFAAHYASHGISTDSGHHASLQRYKDWVASGMSDNFSTWCHKNPTPEDKEASKSSPSAKGDHAHDDGKPADVINAKLIGVGLELIHETVARAAQEGSFSLTIGGDHSVAAASISAVQKSFPELSVIWVDAHADANTPETSPSMHYHGMPAAHLMGWFKQKLEGFDWFPEGGCIDESRLAYIGLRDIDPEEGQMLRDSNVHVYTMREVDKYGIARVIEMALQAIDPNQRNPLHLSLDIDGVDPQFAPGTGTCARGGLTYREIHYVCEELALCERLVGMDLVEVNPALESAPPPPEPLHGDNPDLQPTTPTVLLGVELVLSALGKTIM